MVWGGPGAFFADMGVLDFAGGIVVHITAGIGALVAAMYLGGVRRTRHQGNWSWPSSAPPCCGWAGSASTAVPRVPPPRARRSRAWPPALRVGLAIVWTLRRHRTVRCPFSARARFHRRFGRHHAGGGFNRTRRRA